MVGVPVGFGSVSRIYEVFNSQTVQLLVVPQRLNHVPAQAVDIDPSAGRPLGPAFTHELLQSLVIKML